jgi:hypothetical protein
MKNEPENWILGHSALTPNEKTHLVAQSACTNANTPQEDLISDLLQALQGLFEHCAMTHKYWGDNCNRTEAQLAIENAKDAIAKAKGETP